MSSTIENPPAFPTHNGLDKNNQPHGGMTLRDYFAAKVMQAEITSKADEEAYCYPDLIDGMAKYCYLVADAMLKARAQ